MKVTIPLDLGTQNEKITSDPYGRRRVHKSKKYIRSTFHFKHFLQNAKLEKVYI